MSSTDSIKQAGNEYFRQGKYTEALECFTRLLAVLNSEKTKDKSLLSISYSNRSACYLSLDNPTAALLDAEKCVEYDDQWAKGYSRKGIALYQLQRYGDALAAYEKGLSLDRTNETLLEGVKQVQQAMKEGQKAGKGNAGAAGAGAARPARPATSTTSSSFLARAYYFFLGDKNQGFRTFQMLLRLLLVLHFGFYCVMFLPSSYYSFWKITLLHYLTSLLYTHGRPQWKIDYAIRLFQDPCLPYLIYALLFFTARPSLVVFLPVVIIELAWSVWYGTQITTIVFPTISFSLLTSLLNTVGKTLTQAPTFELMTEEAKWNALWQVIPQYSAYLDVMVGFTLLFDLLTPQRNFILVLVYWQSMRVRYALSLPIQMAFRKLNEKILQLLHLPFIPRGVIGLYLKMTALFGRFVQTMNPSGADPNANAASSSPFSKCSIM